MIVNMFTYLAMDNVMIKLIHKNVSLTWMIVVDLSSKKVIAKSANAKTQVSSSNTYITFNFT